MLLSSLGLVRLVKNRDYKFACDLCDTDYAGSTARYLHQHIGLENAARGRRLRAAFSAGQ